MDRYEVMAGKMAPLTDGAHRKWGFTGKVETRSYERLVDALIDFVETGDGLKARFLCPNSSQSPDTPAYLLRTHARLAHCKSLSSCEPCRDCAGVHAREPAIHDIQRGNDGSTTR